MKTDELHTCEFTFEGDEQEIEGDEQEILFHGPAARTCYTLENGKMYIDNDEYISRVNYCPICGLKADKQI